MTLFLTPVVYIYMEEARLFGGRLLRFGAPVDAGQRAAALDERAQVRTDVEGTAGVSST